MISVREVTKCYGCGETRFQVLKDISLTIEEGEFVVILGASGSGKSTLLNVISGLERPDGGTIFYGETELSALSDRELTAFRRDNVGFIFQQYYLLPNLSVDKNVRMGADLAHNKDYRAMVQEPLRSGPGFCFWMSPPARWTNRLADRCFPISVRFRRSLALPL